MVSNGVKWYQMVSNGRVWYGVKWFGLNIGMLCTQFFLLSSLTTQCDVALPEVTGCTMVTSRVANKTNFFGCWGKLLTKILATFQGFNFCLFLDVLICLTKRSKMPKACPISTKLTPQQIIWERSSSFWKFDDK